MQGNCNNPTNFHCKIKRKCTEIHSNIEKCLMAYSVSKTFYQCPESKNVLVKQAGRTGWISPKNVDLINAITHAVDASPTHFERL